MRADPHSTATYHEVLTIPLTGLVPFVRQQLRVLTIWSVFYWGFNLVVFGGLGYRIYKVAPSLDTVLTGLGQGFFIFFLLLLPLHEAIHAAAYKLLGAPQVRFGAEWRRLVFFAYAEGFLVSRRPFTFVALAPFVLISSGLLTALVLLPPRWEWGLLGGLLLHTGGCFGDFGLVNYFHRQRHRRLYTFDNLAQGTICFVEQQPAEGQAPLVAGAP